MLVMWLSLTSTLGGSWYKRIIEHIYWGVQAGRWDNQDLHNYLKIKFKSSIEFRILRRINENNITQSFNRVWMSFQKLVVSSSFNNVWQQSCHHRCFLLLNHGRPLCKNFILLWRLKVLIIFSINGGPLFISSGAEQHSS